MLPKSGFGMTNLAKSSSYSTFSEIFSVMFFTSIWSMSRKDTSPRILGNDQSVLSKLNFSSLTHGGKQKLGVTVTECILGGKGGSVTLIKELCCCLMTKLVLYRHLVPLDPSHSQTSRLLTSSLSLGVPVP